MREMVRGQRSRQRWSVAAGLCGLLLLGAAKERAQQPHVYSLQGDYWFTHDPSIAKDGGTYYVFATGKAPGGGQLPVRCPPSLPFVSRIA